MPNNAPNPDIWQEVDADRILRRLRDREARAQQRFARAIHPERWNIIDDIPNGRIEVVPKEPPEKMVLPEGRIKNPLLPGFKIPYSVDECHRRLRGTVVVIKGLPWYVQSVEMEPNGEASLTLADDTGHEFRCAWGEIDTLRPPPPCYVSFIDHRYRGTYWMYRRPSTPQDDRHGRSHGDYMQGMTSRNTLVKSVGQGNAGINGAPSTSTIIRALKRKETVKWNPEFESLITNDLTPDLRLTDNIAVYMKRKSLVVEYRGRDLGKIKDDRVVLSDEDKDTPWIYEDCSQAGLGIC